MHPPSTSIVRKLQHYQPVVSSSRRSHSIFCSSNSSVVRFCTKYDFALISRTATMRQPSFILVPAAFLALVPSRTYGWVSQNRPLVTNPRRTAFMFPSPTQWLRDAATTSSRRLVTVDTALESTTSTSDKESIKIAEGVILAQYPGGFTDRKSVV